VIRTSREEARRLVRQARRARGSPRRLRRLAPSLVRNGTVDQAALGEFLLHAEDDPPRALHRPAARQVETMTSTLEDKDEDTKVPGRAGLTAERLLSEAERDVKPIWPDLAGKLQEAGDGL
jgi:hypothetical protein